MKHIVINIGRQFGCGGLEVARVLGQKLGIPVYDNELITKAAQESGFSATLFKESDETLSGTGSVSIHPMTTQAKEDFSRYRVIPSSR